jgi:hypothetical protein
LTEYNFTVQNKIEEKYAPLIMLFLKTYYDAEPQNVRDQCLEYDFCCAGLTFDLKVDTWMKTTLNFFIETESVKGKKKGWLYNTKTDFILYLDAYELQLYIIPLKELQQHETQLETWVTREVHQDKDYVTCGKTIPIGSLKKWMYIRSVDLKPLKNFEAEIDSDASLKAEKGG